MKTKEVKRKEAAIRNEAWNKLSPTQKIKYLNKHSLAAKRQRARLYKEINNG